MVHPALGLRHHIRLSCSRLDFKGFVFIAEAGNTEQGNEYPTSAFDITKKIFCFERHDLFYQAHICIP